MHCHRCSLRYRRTCPPPSSSRNTSTRRLSDLAGILDALTPSTVLVAPSVRRLLVTSAGRVGLIETGVLPLARPLRRSSAGHPRGDLRTPLAVVLTGQGTNAQAGIRAIDLCGGRVIAQDEATSAHLGMPRRGHQDRTRAYRAAVRYRRRHPPPRHDAPRPRDGRPVSE